MSNALPSDEDELLIAYAQRLPVHSDWFNADGAPGTQAAAPYDACLHQLIETRVAATPAALAVIDDQHVLTFAELNRLANALARRLQAAGVGPGDLVGLCVERSPAMLVGVLGILKAGAAYVPMDPDYPAQRLALILADAQIQMLVTRQHLRGMLPYQPEQCVYLELDLKEADMPDTVVSAVHMQHPAYVIYTSGSTGTPNGVVVTHAALVNHALAMVTHYGLQADDRVLQFASLSFDVAAEEIFPTWLAGAAVVLRNDRAIMAFDHFVRFLNQHAISVLNLPASFWHAWVQSCGEIPPDLPASLRLLIVGSEPVSTMYYQTWCRLVGERVRWISAYGPTEATITAMLFAPVAETIDLAQCPYMPLGRPIANVQAYVLDAAGQPVPPGEMGELHLGGRGVARGYLQRPDLTAQRFRPDPFSTEPDARLYQTGDLVRCLPDGTIDYLGRVDQQVKLHGVRIEPGEIEALLLQHPLVHDALVMLREDQPGEQRLVAYVTADRDTQPSASQLREFLSAQIPTYMLPDAFVCLATFPLTPNGKRDRQALPAPVTAGVLPEQYSPPCTDLEALLARIWAEVLPVDRISRDANFFELGGHSLLAIRVIVHLREHLQIELPLRTFFEAHTLADLAVQVERLRHTNKTAAPDILPIQPVPRDHDLPASFAQERLWFIQQFDQDCLAYNSPAAIRLRGTLNIPVLEQSIQAVVRRHEALRTTFALRNGQPVQVIAPVLDVPLLRIDLGHLPPDAREAELARLIDADQRPFDLEHGPLLRITLISIADADYLLLINMHHIITDGWSYGIFYRDLAACYAHYLTGKPLALPDLPIQYADFAHWQRRQLQGAFLESRLAYWKEQLDGCPVLLPLPTDYVRPAVQSLRGETYRQLLPSDLVEQLIALGQAEGCTLFMALLAVFSVLLMRYTGQTDIVIGSPVVERNRAEIENLIGFFVNNLVLRLDVQHTASFRDLLYQVRRVALGAYAHQDLPFDQLIEQLHLPRNLSYQPLLQVGLSMELEPLCGFELPGVQGQHLEVATGGAWSDLMLVLEERPEGLTGVWEYTTDLFTAASIGRMAGHFEHLLHSILLDPDCPVGELPLLNAAERQHMLEVWNQTAVAYPTDCCIHHLFAEQVARTPDAIAVVDDLHTLTFAELNRRADLLASHLQALGAGPDLHVGLCVERSAALLVALLAILKAGGSYVPLDPSYPPARLALILADAQISILVIQPQLQACLPGLSAQIRCLDVEQDSPATLTNPVSPVTPDHAAYVIYTSGSTGTPNGVVVSHAALVHHALAMVSHYALGPADRVLQFASISFDVAAEEIFPTWLAGAAVVVRPEQALTSMTAFGAFLHQQAISVLNLPASFWQAWVQAWGETPPDLPASLRLVIAGSEPVSTAHYQTWCRLAGEQIRFLSAYGPTEATITAMLFAPATETTDLTQRPYMPLGRPIANMQAYVLDATRQPVPPGVAGELYLGGRGVARGYLRRPDLTEQRFRLDPFRTDPAARLYRTGDLARYLPDGTIDYLGRVDQQVKLRGVRIEPGEIEALLRQHSAVRAAVVLTRQLAPSDQRLVAYIVPAPPTPDTDRSLIATLQAFLRDHLPEYMVPTEFGLLDALPLLPSGKLDRQTLLKQATTHTVQQDYVPPRSVLEAQLAEIWADVLGLERVGVSDNFFALGGHSLQIMQLITRMADVTTYPFHIKDIFMYPTIAALASRIEQAPEPAAITPDQLEHNTLAAWPATEPPLATQPLSRLLSEGRVDPIEAATLSTLPFPGLTPALLQSLQISPQDVIDTWCQNRPVFDEVLQTHLGNAAIVTLPCFDDQVYQNQAALVTRVIEGVELARDLGARVVSLAGLLPSATDYGRAILAAVGHRPNLPAISTGHATSVATLVFAIRRMLAESGCALSQQHVAFLGLGSIGRATLLLMLQCLPHPPMITLCDMYRQRTTLEQIRQDVFRIVDYQGTIQIIESDGTLPADIYAATMIIATTSMPEMLEVNRLQPGSLIIDTMVPSCFDLNQAVKRLTAQQDILFTDGDQLQTPVPVQSTRYLPQSAQRMLPEHALALFARCNPQEITSCILSALLSARFTHLQPAVGFVDATSSLQHYTLLAELGFQGCQLHCDEYVLPATHVEQFRRFYGRD